ncbi:MAG: hypothetical protein IT340_11390 [Chloroflexi bacterium]|nr:hypothetical protein [Chloroflexota bacterium]
MHRRNITIKHTPSRPVHTDTVRSSKRGGGRISQRDAAHDVRPPSPVKGSDLGALRADLQPATDKPNARTEPATPASGEVGG